MQLFRIGRKLSQQRADGALLRWSQPTHSQTTSSMNSSYPLGSVKVSSSSWSNIGWGPQDEGPGWESVDLSLSDKHLKQHPTVVGERSVALFPRAERAALESKVSQLQSELLKKSAEVERLKMLMKSLQIENARLRERHSVGQSFGNGGELDVRTVLKSEKVIPMQRSRYQSSVNSSSCNSEEDRVSHSSLEQNDEDFDSCKLFVNGFRRKTTPQELENAFYRLGYEVRAEKPGERRGRRNFAFVIFRCQKERDSCLSHSQKLFVGEDELKLALPIRN